MSYLTEGGKSMPNSHEDLRKVYEELCTSYRAIDDFRAKLLGFLPLASATGIFLLVGTDARNLTPATRPFFLAVGTFGFFITLGLFFYELYGVKKCHALIKAGRELEEDLDIDAQRGQFTARPREVAEVVNEPFAAGVIYPAVLAAWTFVALVPGSQDVQWWTTGLAIGVFVIGFAVALYFNLKLGIDDGIRLVLNIQEEKRVKIRDVRKYFTSSEVEEYIRNKFNMEAEDPGILRKWKYLREMKMEDIHDWKIMHGERVLAKTRGQVVKALIDYLKNGHTSLDDVRGKYPDISRDQTTAYLEVALQDIEYGRILDDVLEKYPSISHEQAVDYLEGKTSSSAGSNQRRSK
jgi:uncharacterized protein (DUF433 family)